MTFIEVFYMNLSTLFQSNKSEEPTTMQDPNEIIKNSLETKIQAFKVARDNFCELREKFTIIQGKIDDAKAKEAEAQGETGELNREIKNLLRSDSPSAKGKLQTLKGKQASVLSLVEEYRSLAEELLLDKEEIELDAQLAAAKQYTACRIAIEERADMELAQALEEVGGRLLKAIRLKAFAMAPRTQNERIFDAGYGDENLAALAQVNAWLSDRIRNVKFDYENDEVYSLLMTGFDVKPFSIDFSPAENARRRSEIKQMRGVTQNA
jgi:hypothetical protein